MPEKSHFGTHFYTQTNAKSRARHAFLLILGINSLGKGFFIPTVAGAASKKVLNKLTKWVPNTPKKALLVPNFTHFDNLPTFSAGFFAVFRLNPALHSLYSAAPAFFV